jgi:hypothetical protein
MTRSQATDRDNKCGEAWFSPLLRIAVVCQEGRNVKEWHHVIRGGQVALHKTVHEIRYNI